MRYFLLALFAATLCAGEATPLTPNADKAYRAYLAAMIKAQQAEAAKLDAALKKEIATANAKKDAATVAALTALQEKAKSGRLIGDIIDSTTGDLMGDGQVKGGVEALYGRWDLGSLSAEPGWENSITIKPNGTAVFTVSQPDTKVVNETTWSVVDSVFVTFNGSTGRTWKIKLPVPLSGPIPAESVGKTVGGEITDSKKLKRLPDAAPAAQQPQKNVKP